MSNDLGTIAPADLGVTQRVLPVPGAGAYRPYLGRGDVRPERTQHNPQLCFARAKKHRDCVQIERWAYAYSNSYTYAGPNADSYTRTDPQAVAT